MSEFTYLLGGFVLGFAASQLRWAYVVSKAGKGKDPFSTCYCGHPRHNHSPDCLHGLCKCQEFVKVRSR